MTDEQSRSLDEFVEFLVDRDVVVDYDPDTDTGWLFRPRDPELDDPNDIIRRPRRPISGA